MYWILFFLFIGGWYFYPTAPNLPREIPYENNYMLGSTVDETEDLKAIGVVEEITPEGLVRMKWDNGQFLYWSVRPIQYKYLETVARKFVIVYNCKENYINIFKELAVAALKPVSEPVHPSVFASFKQYNTKRNQIKNVAIINEKCNQYIWKGKVSSYDTPIVPEVKAIRYSDFKKM
jgi:hypothetical protein